VERDEYLARRDRARVVGDAADRAHRRFRAQRVVGSNEAAAAERAVKFGPGHGWLAVGERSGHRCSTRRHTPSTSIGVPATGSCETTKPSPEACAIMPSVTSLRIASCALIPRRAGTVPGGSSATRLTADWPAE